MTADEMPSTSAACISILLSPLLLAVSAAAAVASGIALSLLCLPVAAAALTARASSAPLLAACLNRLCDDSATLLAAVSGRVTVLSHIDIQVWEIASQEGRTSSLFLQALWCDKHDWHGK
jgi:hypothetical protein